MQDPLANFVLSTAKTLRDGRSRRLHRRRVEEIVGRVAERLDARYGDAAAAHCVTRLTACVGQAPGVRRYIWSRVWMKVHKKTLLQVLPVVASRSVERAPPPQV